jgi:hypothetical protein
MPMTMAAHPWDLARLGVDAALDELEAAGMRAVEVAATYHTMDVISPRGGVRLFTSARGAVLFPARRARYGRIKPVVEGPGTATAWTSVAERARARGVGLQAAVVTLFQPWIVDEHPDCARVLPTGDAVGTSVCPSHPDVREYLAALCDDLVEQFGVATVRFQGPMPATYDFDWLRPRTIVRVPSTTRELLSACFCEHCVARGTAIGLDVSALRRRVQDAIAADLDAGSSAATGALAGDPELRGYLLRFEAAAVELLAGVRGGATTDQPVQLSSTAWTPFPRLLASDVDEVLAGLVATVDHVSLTPGWFTERNRRLKPVAERLGSPLGLGLVIMQLHEGDGDGVPKELAEARSLGVDDLTLFSWGSLRPRDVEAFAAAVRAEFG